MAESLRDELLTIPGIAEAEVEGGADVPAGVRVRLEQGADPDTVGREVQRVLATRGMRSQMTTSSFPPPPPGADRASVVALPGMAPSPSADPEQVLSAPDEPQAEQSPLPPSMPPALDEAQPPVVGPAVSSAGLASVSVEEGRAGVIVRASTTDGRTAARRARPSESGLDEAIVAVVAELVGPTGTPPLLVAAEEQDIGGTTMVTVVVEVGEGERAAGSSVLEGGRPYAVARAAWSALVAAN